MSSFSLMVASSTPATCNTAKRSVGDVFVSSIMTISASFFLGKVWEVLSPFGVAVPQSVRVLKTMEANKFTWKLTSIFAHFENQIYVSGSACSFKLRSITCYPISEERKIALAKQLNCLHVSSSS